MTRHEVPTEIGCPSTFAQEFRSALKVVLGDGVFVCTAFYSFPLEMLLELW